MFQTRLSCVDWLKSTDCLASPRLRKRSCGRLSFFLFLMPLSLEAQTAPDPAHRLLQTTLEQLGGKARLQTVSALRAKGIRTQNLLEQSERFEGPWLRNVFDFEEVCDFRALEHRVRTRIRGDQFAEWTKAEFSFTFREGLHRQGSPFLQTPQESAERLSQDPLRLLLLAENAADLRTGKTIVQHRVPCQPLSFTLGKTPITVFLNSFTHLPASVETVSLRQDFWSVWGDVTSRTEYNNWQTLSGGWRYPFSVTVVRNGLPHLSTTLTEVKIEVTSEPLSSAQDDFAQIQSAFRAPKPPASFVFRSQTVAEGIEQFPGGFNTHVIVLPEGLVVLEPINNSEFSEAFLGELNKRFPGKPVCAVIATDDSWPHCGGLRPYVARGVPIYALSENRAVLQGMAASPHRLNPDALQRNPRPLLMKPVRGKVMLGHGMNRVELLPVRGMESERMIAVYFPERHLLYGSDLVQRMPDGSLYNPQITQELSDLVRREKLKVERVFAMHSEPIAWKTLEKALTQSTALPADPKP